jgi:hypothetical protein
MFRMLFCTLLLVLTGTGSSQHAHSNHGASDTPTILELSSSGHSLPHFSFYDEPDCDNDGNAYFHLNSGTYNTSTILKLSSTLEKSTLFKLSGEYSDGMAYYGFTVTPSGTLRVLAADKKGFYVFDFESDGTMTGRTRLAVPEHADISHFASLDSGVSLVSGYFDKDASANIAGKSFIATFDAAGRQIREVKYSHKFDLSEDNLTIQQGSAMPAKDGNFYLLLADRILVISPTGSIERTISLEPPEAHALAMKLFVSNGTLGIVFRARKEHSDDLKTYFVVLYVSTGERLGLYVFPENATGHVLCYSRKDGITSFAYANNTFTLATSTLK